MRQRAIPVLFVGLVFAALAASATYGGSSGTTGSRIARSVLSAGGMPASVRVRDAWASVLRCEYAHGATKQALGRDSFEVVGLTSAVRAACADLEAHAQLEMASATYLAEQAEFADVMRAVWACVASKGIDVGDDQAASDTATAPPGTEAAFRGCKQRVELQRGLTEAEALP